MRIFVYEYISSGAMTAPAPSLRAEGWAMLSAVLDDLGACPRVTVTTLLDPALAASRQWPPNIKIHATKPEGEEASIRELARTADFTLLIAPEFEDILGVRCQWVEEVGGRLLGPSSTAVRLTADKLLLAERLEKAGVPTPRTVPCSASAAGLGFPLVVKPRDGAGSQATYLVRDQTELEGCAARAKAEAWHGELIAQQFVEGIPVSVSFITGPGGKFCLKPVRQYLTDDGRFRYLGGSLPLPGELAARARGNAARVLTAMEGLRGWFGVDLVLHSHGNSIIEINPRLTTSYIGLRRLSKFNLMDTLLATASAETSPLIDWYDRKISFLADGTVREES